MKIDDSVLERVEKVSRLSLTSEEKQKIFSDLNDTLNAFSIINEVNVDKEKSSFIPIILENTLREDVPNNNCNNYNNDALNLASNLEDNQLIGPRTIE